MATTAKPRPGVKPTRLSNYLAKQIDALAGIKSQREIAYELGYDKGNIVSMWKTGEAKFPLHKLPDLARVLHIDLGFLLRLAVEQYFDEDNSNKIAWDELSRTLDRVISSNEMEIIQYIRKVSGDSDPRLDDKLRIALSRALESGHDV